MIRLLPLLTLIVATLVASVSAANVVEFPRDFTRVEVGGVVAYYAPNVTCPIIVVSPPFNDEHLARLLNVTANYTAPWAAYGIVSTLREAVGEAGGVLYQVGVIGTSPPAGFVAAYGLNVTKFAELVEGIRVVVFVLPWRVQRPASPEESVKVEGAMLRALEGEPAYSKLKQAVRQEASAKARALRSWILGNDSALEEKYVKMLREMFINAKLEGETLRRSVKKVVEDRIGKPVENATDEELSAALPYTIGSPTASISAGAVDSFLGIPSLNLHALPSANVTAEEMKEAGIRVLSKVLNCTPGVLYIYTGPLGYFRYMVGFFPAAENAVRAATPTASAQSPGATASRGEASAATWPPALIAAFVATAAAAAYLALRRR